MEVSPMLAAPGRWTRSDELPGMVTVGVIGLEGAEKVTPVVAHPGWEASAVIGPFAANPKTWTAAEFGLVARTMTSAVPPGTSVVVGWSPPVNAVTVTVCMVPDATLPEPVPPAEKLA